MKRELTDEEMRQAVEQIERQLAEFFEDIYRLGLVWVSLGLDLDEFLEKVHVQVKNIEARLFEPERERSNQ